LPPRPARFPRWRNWGGNFECRPAAIHAPTTIDQLRAIVLGAAAEGKRVRPVGSGYSYTRLAQTDEVMVSLDGWAGIERIDREQGIAVIRSGTTLRRIERELAEAGYAFENLGDINRQTLAGAVATGTHGTGIGLGNMSTQVDALEMVTADGRVVTITRSDGDLFRAAAISLGALGIVTRIWLRVLPLYWLQIERRRETLAAIAGSLDTRVRANRNFEFFWFPASDLVYSKTMNLTGRGPDRGRSLGHWLNDLINENLALWAVCELNHRRPAWRAAVLNKAAGLVPQGAATCRADVAYATERLVVHQEMEYAVPADRAVTVLAHLDRLLRHFPTRTMFPIEVRFTRADDLLLSPSCGRDVAYIAVHTWWKEDHHEYFDAAEAVFLAAGGRPHWGKLHGLAADRIAALYPTAPAFERERRQLDPRGMFLNRYLERLLPGAAAVTPSGPEILASAAHYDRST
jgi:FAD-linked oxidoreductase